MRVPAPFLGAPRVSRLLRGQTYQVLGRNEDTSWFLLQLSGTQAWAWGYYLAINGNEFSVPIVSPFTTAGEARLPAPEWSAYGAGRC